jgi:hypothetical protein
MKIIRKIMAAQNTKTKSNIRCLSAKCEMYLKAWKDARISCAGDYADYKAAHEQPQLPTCVDIIDQTTFMLNRYMHSWMMINGSASRANL